MSDRLLYVLCCEVGDPVARAAHGTLAERFDRTLGIAPSRRATVAVFRGETLPDPGGFAGIVVSGSPAMVSDPEPWIGRLAEWVARAAAGPAPLLGICFGHQILAHALGGRVDFGPAGWEYGMVDVRATPQARGDALFGPLPAVMRLTESHKMSVLEPPPGATVLATSPGDACHAFRAGTCAWGVQFHPERDAAAMRRQLEADRKRLERPGGVGSVDALIAAMRPSGDGEALMRRFREITGAPAA